MSSFKMPEPGAREFSMPCPPVKAPEECLNTEAHYLQLLARSDLTSKQRDRLQISLSVSSCDLSLPEWVHIDIDYRTEDVLQSTSHSLVAFRILKASRKAESCNACFGCAQSRSRSWTWRFARFDDPQCSARPLTRFQCVIGYLSDLRL